MAKQFGFPNLAQALWEVLSQEHYSKPFRVQTWNVWGREGFSGTIPHIWSDISEGSGVEMQQTWEAERVASHGVLNALNTYLNIWQLQSKESAKSSCKWAV